MAEALQLTPTARAYARTAVAIVRKGEKLNFSEVARRHNVSPQAVHRLLKDDEVVQYIERTAERQSDKAGAELRRLNRLGESVQRQLLAIYEERQAGDAPIPANELAAIAKLASDLRSQAADHLQKMGHASGDTISAAEIDRQLLKDRLTLRRFIVKALRRPAWGRAVVRLIERLHGLEEASTGEG